ncbi:MAG: pyridoxal-phosphate dependent enzyme [Myxococcota bacterium]
MVALNSSVVPPQIDGLDPEVLCKFAPLQDFAEQLDDRVIEIPREPGCGRVFAKYEAHNPTGTVKDRVALALLWSLLQQKGRAAGLPVLEYSGGSLAASLAMLCEQLEMPLNLVLSSAADASLVERLRQHGAHIDFVAKEKGFHAVMQKGIALSLEHPEWNFLYQHENQANILMHETRTGPDLLRALPVNRVDAWVASIGTGGTLIGIYRALRAVHPQVELFATSPAELPYGSDAPPNGIPKFSGSGGIGDGIRQTFVERHDADVRAHMFFSYPETLRLMKTFHRMLDVWVGSSAAANLAAAQRIARQKGEDSIVVTIIPSLASPEERAKAMA